ncbi:MAG: glycine cleavage system protein GcvH [Bdellovibrionales bacterium]|jgi:glycine cleavage system H protein|nr:glycine cleavage system protein GcvH [Bdellovibrionales bacterium]
MSNTPSELKYTQEHEWAKLEGEVISIGITDFAQSSLGDIVFLELPEVGTSLDKDSPFGVVESIKSVSDLFSPLAGEVIEVNSELVDSPENINENAYDNWMIKVKPANMGDYEELMSAEQYTSFCDEN